MSGPVEPVDVEFTITKPSNFQDLARLTAEYQDGDSLSVEGGSPQQIKDKFLEQLSGDMPETPNTKPSNPKDALGCRKPPLSTVPMNVVFEIGTAMLEGALKYGRHNYRTIGVRASVYFDATMRHLCAWWEGEDIDPDSGMSHITKALSSLVVLRDAMMNDKVNDDRPPRSNGSLGANCYIGELLEQYPTPPPPHTHKEPSDG